MPECIVCMKCMKEDLGGMGPGDRGEAKADYVC